MSYTLRNAKQKEQFVKLSAGAQLGYQGTLEQRFETYAVFIEGEDFFYYFVRPEIGIRRYLKKKIKGSRYRVAYELAVFYRHNFNGLGTAKIVENDFEVSLLPQGNVIGAYLRFLFPLGRKRIKVRERELVLPPIIHNPRYL